MYCEAMVAIKTTGSSGKPMYHICGNQPADLHHKITRARGGLLLDAVGETYHQIWLCRPHHDYAHDNPRALEGGLLLAGSVITGMDGQPVYTGPDEYLTGKYGLSQERADEIR